MDNDNTIMKERQFKIEKLGQTVLLFGIEILVSLAAVLIVAFSSNETKEMFNTQIVQTTLWLIGKVVPLIIILIMFFKYFKDCITKTKRNVKRFLIYLLLGFGIFYICEMATTYYQLLMDKLFDIGDATNQEAIQSYFKNDQSFLNYLLLFITIVIVAPIIEEMEFRKLVFDAFGKKVHFLVPTLVSGFLFGLIHIALSDLSAVEISYFPLYFIPGVALALVYYFSGKNVLSSILVHSISNCISYFAIIIAIQNGTL